MYVSNPGDSGPSRLGCRFSNMLATSLKHLMHYVSRLERSRMEK